MGTSELDGSGRARSESGRAHLPAARPGFVEPSDDVMVLRQVAWPGLTRPLDELVAAPSGLWIVEPRPWRDIAVARGRVITADADVTLDVQRLDQVRVRVARDLGLTPVEAHALVVVPEEVPALRLEGVVIVGQRLVRQIVLSPGRRLTPTQLDVLARRTAKVLGREAHPAQPAPAAHGAPQAAAPQTALPELAPPVVGTALSAGPRESRRVPRPLPSPTEPVPTTPLPASLPEPVVPTPTPVAPEAVPVEPEPPVPELDGPHDEPPPPLPTPEELGLPPALPDPSARQRPPRTADPIWPIAPPPGLWSAPEPEPDLARLVADVEPGPDADDLAAGASEAERTRVVEASAAPEVDEDESEMGRTRVVDYPSSEPRVTPSRGLPAVIEPGAGGPGALEPEPAWPESLGEPGPTTDDLTYDDPTVAEPVGAELISAELIGAELIGAEPDSPPPDQPVGLEVADGVEAEPTARPRTVGLAAEPEPITVAGPVVPEPVGVGPVGVPLDPLVGREVVAEVDLVDAQAEDSGPIGPTSWSGRASASGLDVPVEPSDDLSVEPDVVELDLLASDDQPAGLDEEVELTRIRPPDRPPASQSLADARRAFFSGAGADPDMVFRQTPLEDEAVPNDVPGGLPRGRRPAPARPPARLPVAWDDDPPPADGPPPQVAWDPRAPRRTGRPQVTWDDEPARPAPEPRPRYRSESPRRSVAVGPRPPAEHPVRPGDLPSRRRVPDGPSAEPTSGPPPYAAERRGQAPPVPPPSPRPPRRRPVRGGPWDLSPAQAAAVGGRFPGPARIRGAFGTGRSVAAAYRAVHLAQTRPGLVALVVPALAQVEPMRRRLASLGAGDGLERIVVDVPAGLAQTVLAEFGTEVVPAPESVARAWSQAQRTTGLGAAQGRSIGLLRDEVALIRGRSLTDERDYDRLRQEVPAGLRHQVWVLHEAYLAELRRRNLPDEHDLVRMARAALRAGVPSQLTAVVVDDANDLTPDQLTMLRETVGTGTDALTVLDDGLPGLLPVGATLGEAGIDVAQRQVDLAHEFRLTGPAWTSLVRLLQADPGRDVAGASERPRLAGRLDDGEGPSYLRSQAIRLRRDKLVERVAELVGAGVSPASIALLHIEDEPEPELVTELVRAGVVVRGLDALDVPGVALGRARDARGVEFDHVLVPDARHRDVVPVGGLRWDQRQRRRLLGLALSRSRETAWIAGV